MNYEISDFTVDEVCKRWTQKQLQVNHEYQRAPRWTDRQKQLLIDSVLRGYALPSFFLHRKKRPFGDQTIEELFIVDGQQRIQSLVDFKEGEFSLLDPAKNSRWFPKFIADAEIPCEWANRTYEQLDVVQRSHLNSTRLRVVLIDAEEDEVRDLFVRLQAGSPLRPQDKRDAFPGGMPNYIKHLGGYVERGENQEVKVIGGHPIFRQFLKWSSPATTHLSRELAAKIVMQLIRDGQGQPLSGTNSLALDAFYHQHVNFREDSTEAKRIDSVFDEVFGSLSQYQGTFPTAMEWVHLFVLFQRLQRGYTGSWKRYLKRVLQKFKRELASAQDNTANRASDPLWTEFGMLRSGRGADGSTKFTHRQKFFDDWFKNELRPEEIDPRRSFDIRTRDLLWDAQVGVCGYHDHDFCENTPLQRDEAEVHHILPHSQGGKTERSNAVLTHASCNQHIGSTHKPISSQLILNALKSFSEPS